MTGKSNIIRELGEGGLLLPEMVNNGLCANDKIKYYFTLLQTAQPHAEQPGVVHSNLSRERESAGILSDRFDRIVQGSKKTGTGNTENTSIKFPKRNGTNTLTGETAFPVRANFSVLSTESGACWKSKTCWMFSTHGTPIWKVS